ncbi:MAG: M15 family metallopeptidase [Treponema sp.]|nr:M15 family metallopeptidase [Treponema sp.]
MNIKKCIIRVLSLLVLLSPAFADAISEPVHLALLKKAYPDVQFSCTYDPSVRDYLVHVQVDSRSADLYWSDGRLLPKDELVHKDRYWSLLYRYEKEVLDPKNFTPQDIENIKKFTSKENRRNGAGTPPFFFDVLYDCKTRAATERHIIKTTFLGKTTNIHERIAVPLRTVEARIRTLAKKDTEVALFIERLSRADSYSWREIRDSSSRSFHSLGIAIDILPKGWGQKNVYWAWRRDIEPDTWMLLPLERRWMPPSSVIQIFEEEGFIYGGKWVIWDNMHFEYHPELILYRDNK